MRWILPLVVALTVVPAVHAGSAAPWNYVVFSDGSPRSFGTGASDDFSAASHYRVGDAPLLYVRRGGTAYVIRDPGLLARAAAITAPQRELGRQQGELGKQQAALGRQQGLLGRDQGRLGKLVADSTARQMSEIGRQQSELGRRQSVLGAKQSVLSARQSELGREQARAAQIAEPKLRALIEDALRRNLAQRVD